MGKRCLGLTMFACACSVAWVEAMAGQTLAAQKSTKAGSKLPDVFIISKQQSHALEKRSERATTESKARRSKRHQTVKVPKNSSSQTEMRPSVDHMYYGMLEGPRRYDPSLTQRKGGIPNPQAGELHYEHFQELDRNRDGVIDPFERVSGRLDIERDLANRQ